VEKFFGEAARLRRDPVALGALQAKASQFVTELHDTAKNVDAFRAVLTR